MFRNRTIHLPSENTNPSTPPLKVPLPLSPTAELCVTQPAPDIKAAQDAIIFTLDRLCRSIEAAESPDSIIALTGCLQTFIKQLGLQPECTTITMLDGQRFRI